ncbi:MAG: hypothetical protein ABJ360_22145 [Roseobacter sp.]
MQPDKKCAPPPKPNSPRAQNFADKQNNRSIGLPAIQKSFALPALIAAIYLLPDHPRAGYDLSDMAVTGRRDLNRSGAQFGVWQVADRDLDHRTQWGGKHVRPASRLKPSLTSGQLITRCSCFGLFGDKRRRICATFNRIGYKL